MRTFIQVDRGINHIAKHRTCRWVATSTAAVKHQRTRRFAIYNNGVKRIAHGSKWVMVRHHGRMHTHRDRTAGVFQFGNRQKLDRITQPMSNGNICRSDFGNSFAVHIAGNNVCTKSNARDN